MGEGVRKFTYPRAARLSLARDFDAIYQRGDRVNVYPLRVRALRRPDTKDATPLCSRLGFAVSRKVGGAVVRNRWKRVIREAFRMSQHLLPGPFDIVVGVAWDAKAEDVARVREAFLAVIESLRKRG